MTDILLPPVADVLPAEYRDLDIFWEWKNGISRLYSYASGYPAFMIQLDTPFASQCTAIQFLSDTQAQWQAIPTGIGHWVKKSPYGDATHWRVYHLKRIWFTDHIMPNETLGDDVWNPSKYRALCTLWP